MKALAIALLVTAAVALATGSTNLPVQVQNTLTTIDVVPTKQQIDTAFGSEQTALQTLTAIATDPDPSNVGIRLRAIHALAKYCGPPPTEPCAATDVAHQAVIEVMDEILARRPDATGSDVLLLRAAIETLGQMRVSSDVSKLTALLEDASRDIRASTARALRDLCNPQAITPLRQRYNGETTDQVKLAISEALRILGQCSAGT